MVSEKVRGAINEQINWELYSAYLYLSMSAYFESINLSGFANWMRMQAKEEVGHAMRFYNHLLERSGRVLLSSPIKAPPSQWGSALVVFEDGYRHEQQVTGLIDNLVNLAEAEKDNAFRVCLQWFVAEQVEEEVSFGELVQKLKLAADTPDVLSALDRELAKRE